MRKCPVTTVTSVTTDPANFWKKGLPGKFRIPVVTLVTVVTLS